MPDKDFVTKALESAKGALASAKKFTASTGDSDPSMFSVKHTAPAPPPKAKPAGTSLVDEAGSAAAGLKAKGDMMKGVMPSMKKGGMVKATGPHLLHKGEAVIPKEVMDKATSALGGKKPKKKLRMTIKPTDDDRFHVMHDSMGSEPMENTEHAPSSLEELLAHVQKHYGPEEAAEGEKTKE